MSSVITKSILSKKKAFITLHLGAGYHDKKQDKKYKEVCRSACNKGIKMLLNGQCALDTAVEICAYLEDDPITNAGFGSNLTVSGTVECEAAIMDSTSNCFGAVACCSCVKNPIKIAKYVMLEQLKPSNIGLVHPLVLSGDTKAKEIACENNMPVISNSALISNKSKRKYEKYLSIYNKSKQTITVEQQSKKRKLTTPLDDDIKDEDLKFQESESLDTIGVICVDNDGNIATAASSGGIALKQEGRIGHVPHYGCGCWAFNNLNDKLKLACCTSGCGEVLIRTNLAKRVAEEYIKHKDCFISLDEIINNEFLNSPYINQMDSKLCGVLFLTANTLTSIDLHIAHTTKSFAIGYCSSSMRKPNAFISRLDDPLHVGKKCLSQCINVNL